MQRQKRLFINKQKIVWEFVKLVDFCILILLPIYI